MSRVLRISLLLHVIITILTYVIVARSEVLSEWDILNAPCTSPSIVACDENHKKISLNFTQWHLRGPIPPMLFSLTFLRSIDLSLNNLNSTIPEGWDHLPRLENLNLSHNRLEGRIPQSISYLRNLRAVDLSSNLLFGQLNISVFRNFKQLQVLNLSHNKLSGRITYSDVWPIVLDLQGNPDLCGPEEFSLPSCGKPKRKIKVNIPEFKISVIVIAGVIIIFILFLFIKKFVLKKYKKPRSSVRSHSVISTGSESLKKTISYEELATATDNFSESRKLGKGSFGTVYKGILPNGEIIAVKVLNMEKEGKRSSFSTECNALREARHRNLMRILSVCTSDNFKALVYKYMSKGSLEDVLYSDEGRVLGIEKILEIAVDVAQALEYLHHDSHVQIVHSDIKPSNILLDENMKACVSDFGVARLVSTITNTTLDVSGSLGYIAPEYGVGAVSSTKADVYGYGVVLLELLTRKRPTDELFQGELTLHKWVYKAFPNKLEDVLDEYLINELSTHEKEYYRKSDCLLTMVHIGLLCSMEAPHQRPTCREVAWALYVIQESSDVGNQKNVMALLNSQTGSNGSLDAHSDIIES